MKNRFYTSNDDYTSITYKNDFRIKMLTKALRKLGEFPRKIEIFTVDAPDFYNEVFYTIDKNNQTFFLELVLNNCFGVSIPGKIS